MSSISCFICGSKFIPIAFNQICCSCNCKKKLAKHRKTTIIQEKSSTEIRASNLNKHQHSENTIAKGPITLPLPFSSFLLAYVSFSGQTRSEIALSKLTSERLQSLLSSSVRYSESTLKKHAWVTKLYEGFCKTIDHEPWPLESAYVSGFIRFLGLDAKYAIGSLEDVIIPSLKRIHYEKTSKPLNNEISQYMSQALKDVKNSKTHLRSTEGKEPAIVLDIQRIIECTPAGIPTKAEEASLWLTALSTGVIATKKPLND